MSKTTTILIFIDESGTLPDPRDKFVVICGVVVAQAKEAENIISRVLDSLRKRKTNIREIKFYHAGQNTKRQFLSGMVAARFDIFALVVDKRGRKISDSPENFAVLVAELINEINLWYKNPKLNIHIDRHFQRKFDQDVFNSFLQKGLYGAREYSIKHIESQQDLLVNVADMAAGSVLWKYTGKDLQFYNIIRENILMEKIVSWPEMKRRSLSRNKKLT